MLRMNLAWLVWLVALYVSLDVSNPLMPGALMFGMGVGESVQVRQADRLRVDDDAGPLPLWPAPKRIEPVEQDAVLARMPAPNVPRTRQSHVEHPRRAVSTSPTVSPEDH
jgi:hypothetical protein